jgi:hypothetical protein
MFSIETSSGKVVRGHSYFQQENEIILPPGRYFKVIDKSSPAQDLHIIHLREITPPHPMLADPFNLSELKKALPLSEASPSPYSSIQKYGYYSAASVKSKPIPLLSISDCKHENLVASSTASKPSVPVSSKTGKFLM